MDDNYRFEVRKYNLDCKEDLKLIKKELDENYRGLEEYLENLRKCQEIDSKTLRLEVNI